MCLNVIVPDGASMGADGGDGEEQEQEQVNRSKTRRAYLLLTR